MQPQVLDRCFVDKTVAAAWEAVENLDPESHERHEAAEEATQRQAALYQQIAQQNMVLKALWAKCVELSPLRPINGAEALLHCWNTHHPAPAVEVPNAAAEYPNIIGTL